MNSPLNIFTRSNLQRKMTREITNVWCGMMLEQYFLKKSVSRWLVSSDFCLLYSLVFPLLSGSQIAEIVCPLKPQQCQLPVPVASAIVPTPLPLPHLKYIKLSANKIDFRTHPFLSLLTLNIWTPHTPHLSSAINYGLQNREPCSSLCDRRQSFCQKRSC